MATSSHRIRHATSPAKPGPPREPQRSPAPPPPPRWRAWLLLAGVIVTLLLLFGPSPSTTTTHNYNYSQFLSQVEHNHVKTASIDPSGAVKGGLTNKSDYTTQIPTALNNSQLTGLLEAHHVEITGVASSTSVLSVLLSFLPLLLFVGLFVWLGRRSGRALAGGIMGFGGSRAKVYQEERPSTRFSDVAGYEGAKREVAEVVDFLKDPAKYSRAGAVGPRGVLMVGPPGSGKTLMARAVAGEAEVPFLALTGSSFVEMFVGVGASRVRDLFANARKLAPSIIFIDEIDAIGQRRGGSIISNDEREQTLNQMLAEMDGFDPATGVVVMAATNRPEVLDPALLRPGRFDRQVEIPLPNQAERKAILAVHSRGKHLDPNVDLDAVARATPGFSGADLANLVNEAAIVAVRNGRNVVREDDLDSARDRVILGRRDDSNALLPDEKRSVAIHEAGHALVALLSEHADPVAKITILPAGRALGVTEQLPVDERHLYSESYLHDSLAIRLGGRASELVVAGEASTGAASDLSGATELAIHMVRDWGLSPRLGPVGFSSDGPGYLGGGQQFQTRPYAEGTQQVIDEEVTRLLSEAEERARSLLVANRAALDAVVALLLERETISGEELSTVVQRTRDGTSPARQPRSLGMATATAHEASVIDPTGSDRTGPPKSPRE
ncbi:MAG TPA: ATP-dependent zinc metalloprotease FtsH [Acidimicrobiales bacterium]|nr:ATP-dependent zinc metalloprotease FtsH [Acidimicrobiales bacterium]